jgi:hypothetical protein
MVLADLAMDDCGLRLSLDRSGPRRIFVLAFSAILGLSIAVSRFSCRLSHRRWEFNPQGLDS